MLDQIARVCLSHFLCEFDPKSKKRLTRDVVSRIALPFFSADMVDEFIDERLPEFSRCW